MKVFYIANNQLPTTKAHGLQIVKMCEAFTRLGVECELIVPNRAVDPSIEESDILKYYGIKTSFKITKLKSPGFIFYSFWGNFLSKLIFWFQQFSFARLAAKYVNEKSGVVYTRDQFAVYALRKQKIPVFWEVHNIPKKLGGYFYDLVFSKTEMIFTISNHLKDKLTEKFKKEIFVVPDGVDLNDFEISQTQDELRKHLGLPENKVIALYAGHLYPWKGIKTLVSASHNLPNNCMVVCVGGTSGDLEFYQKQEKDNRNILFIGHKPHQEIPKYLKAADMLLLPNSAEEDISRLYTSPLKMFEYMAANKPIIASDLPSIREILDENCAYFVQSDDGKILAQKITEVYRDHSSPIKASVAFDRVRYYTWQERAARIIDHLE